MTTNVEACAELLRTRVRFPAPPPFEKGEYMGVYEKIQTGEYKNKKLFPSREDFSITKICKHCGSRYKDVETEKKFIEARRAYREETARLENKLKEDLFKEAGITDNTKAEKLWEKAWGNGHSAGYSEIYTSFYDLLELIQ